MFMVGPFSTIVMLTSCILRWKKNPSSSARFHSCEITECKEATVLIEVDHFARHQFGRDFRRGLELRGTTLDD